jgi:hypothetical protein
MTESNETGFYRVLENKTGFSGDAPALAAILRRLAVAVEDAWMSGAVWVDIELEKDASSGRYKFVLESFLSEEGKDRYLKKRQTKGFESETGDVPPS